MKHLRLLENNDDYYKSKGSFVNPWVAYIKQGKVFFGNETDENINFSMLPFCFQNISDTDVTISLRKRAAAAATVSLQVSTDNVVWTEWGSSSVQGLFKTIPANGKLFIKSTGNTGQWNNNNTTNGFFADGAVIVYGNLMSLIYKDFMGKTGAISTYSYVFMGLFMDMTDLIDASHLVFPSARIAQSHTYAMMFSGCVSLVGAPELPATELNTSCYNNMFTGCISLEVAPELPATNLVNSCYNNMFGGCSSLCYVKAMFVTPPEAQYTNMWMKDVAEHGVFIKNSEATWEREGITGVPVGWSLRNHDDSRLYSFGVLSDWHYGASSEMAFNGASFVSDDTIANFYRQEGVGFVTLNGDLTHNGTVGELSGFKSMVNTKFVNNGIPFFFNNGNRDAVCPDSDYETAVGREKNTVEVRGNDVFIFASMDYTNTLVSLDTADTTYRGCMLWLLHNLEKYRDFRKFLFVHFCISGMAGTSPLSETGFKKGSDLAKSILNMVQEVGNTIIFTGHSHFDVGRDIATPIGYTNFQRLENNTWLVHVPSCSWCVTGNGGETDRLVDNGYYRSQGYVAEAYPDKVVLKTYEFNTGRWLEDYVFEITDVVSMVGANSVVDSGGDDIEIPDGMNHVVLEAVTVNEAYWNTDYHIVEGDTMEWKGTLTKYSQYLMGSSDASNLKRFDFQYLLGDGGSVQFGFSTSSFGRTKIALIDGKPHTLRGNSQEFYVDDKLVGVNKKLVFNAPTAPIRVCGINGGTYGTNTTQLYIGDFYEASIYDSKGEVKRHWIPVFTKDGIKLYETVTDTYIKESGNGLVTFVGSSPLVMNLDDLDIDSFNLL